jgi:hypothetical protein
LRIYIGLRRGLLERIAKVSFMITGQDFDELAFAEKQLAESRDRMKDYRNLENSFVPGSVERERAGILVEEIEVLHQIMDRLCYQLRLRR